MASTQICSRFHRDYYAVQALARSTAFCQRPGARSDVRTSAHLRLEATSPLRSARRASRFGQKPAARPARYAAPSAVVSVMRGRTTGTPRTSAWNCIRRSFTAAPPSTRSSRSGAPVSAAHSFEHVGHLPGDGFERGAGDVSVAGIAAEADQKPNRVRVPVRRAQAHKRRYKDHAAGVGHARGEGLDIGRGADELQIVAQPLHHRAGNKDAALERVLEALLALAATVVISLARERMNSVPMFSSRKQPVP